MSPEAAYFNDTMSMPCRSNKRLRFLAFNLESIIRYDKGTMYIQHVHSKRNIGIYPDSYFLN